MSPATAVFVVVGLVLLAVIVYGRYCRGVWVDLDQLERHYRLSTGHTMFVYTPAAIAGNGHRRAVRCRILRVDHRHGRAKVLPLK